MSDQPELEAGVSDSQRDADLKEILELRQRVAKQAGYISRLRAENIRLRTLRLRIATGELADQVNMEEELGKQTEFLPNASPEWDEALKLLRKAAEKDPDAKAALEKLE